MKKYKDAEGNYLDITQDQEDRYRIAWFLPADDDFGMVVGDKKEKDSEPPTDPLRWEQWTAYKAMEPFAAAQDFHGFCFETFKKAKMALNAANLALCNPGSKPMPAWTVEALAANWKPPTGWKP